jgi:hypothetical protein
VTYFEVEVVSSASVVEVSSASVVDERNRALKDDCLGQIRVVVDLDGVSKQYVSPIFTRRRYDSEKGCIIANVRSINERISRKLNDVWCESERQ